MRTVPVTSASSLISMSTSGSLSQDSDGNLLQLGHGVGILLVSSFREHLDSEQMIGAFDLVFRDLLPDLIGSQLNGIGVRTAPHIDQIAIQPHATKHVLELTGTPGLVEVVTHILLLSLDLFSFNLCSIIIFPIHLASCQNAALQRLHRAKLNASPLETYPVTNGCAFVPQTGHRSFANDSL